MDNRITKKRLNDHLSYDWIKYIAIVLAAILLWSLVFTMIKPRVPNNMTFNMYLITPGANSAEIDTVQSGIADELSDTVISAGVSFWGESESTTSSLISTRFSTFEGDMIAFSNYQKTGDAEADKNITSVFNSYVDSSAAANIIYPLSDLIGEIMKDSFINVDEQEFRRRKHEERKFNKIDTEEDMLAAIEAEREWRMEVRRDAIKLAGYLGMTEMERYGADLSTEIVGLAYRYVQFSDSENPDLSDGTEKIWGINVGYVGSTMPLSKIGNLIIYPDDEEQQRHYTLGLLFKQVNDPYCYAYVKVFNYLIERYK